jgi:hypothetical protein
MGERPVITVQNWEKISGENQKKYKNFLEKAGKRSLKIAAGPA